MKKILIIADGITTAHPTRMEQLVNQIDKSKFEIHFATTANYFPLLSLSEKFKIPLYPITSVSTKTFMDRLYNTQFPWTRAELDFQLKEDLELIQKVRPDIVIGDTRLSLMVACKKENVTYYNLMNFHWNPLYQRPMAVPFIKQVELFGRKTVSSFSNWITPLVLNSQKRSVNKWLKSNGMTPVKTIFDFYCQGDYLLFPDLEKNYKSASVPQNGYFIGPLLWKNTSVKWPTEWGQLNPEKKYALVSMGSSGETKHIPKVVKALNFLGYVVIYVGPKSILENPEAYQVLTADFVPLDQVLDHCELAVGNGGTGTTYYYLSKGVPSYYVPTNMDQYLSVMHLKELGLSDYQDVDGFSEKTFIEKITRLVNSNQVKASCEAVQIAIHEEIKSNRINQILMDSNILS